MANTTSSAYAFDQNFSIDEIIADAYERLGLVGTAGHQIKTARRSLNILFQEWGNRGIHFWEVGNTNINLVVGSSTNVDATAEGSGIYTFYRNSSDVPGGGEPPQATTVPTANIYGISDILNVTYRQNYNTTSQSDIGLTKVARDAYSATANKASLGTPSQFWVQRFIDKVTITIYPMPNATAASNYLNVYYVKRIQDAGAYTNASDAEPPPVGADPQGLQHARPARVEFPVQDILPNNPFTTTGGSPTLSVSYPANQINDGTTYVRFQSVKEIVGGVAISTLQLETTLNGNISDSATTVVLTDATQFPTSGFIMIEKIDTTPNTDNYGKYFNEVIKYTGKSSNNLTGCTRGPVNDRA
jgi:hypothetical protein